MNLYGLIGYPLTHSFSKRFFTEKFAKEGISNSRYDLFEMNSVDSLPDLLTKTPNLRGLNVTIPHKQAVVPLLDDLDEASAGRIGAVNTIKIFADGTTKGYNTDYYGFRQSVEEWLDRRGESQQNLKALVLGNGGAARAVKVALKDMKTSYKVVSRQEGEDSLRYEDITEEIIDTYRLIINTTPLGMYPNTEECPPLPYDRLTHQHFLYDLVYNPVETLFLKKGAEKGAITQNGLKMLYLQAEKAWEIWNNDEDLWNR
ncbi:shikimate dehydrogenase [Rhabdobacter roseus]|uniref:Shikimate dehydrogenase n=1 Tax=Rhabdobacter roseus TaxID=1655419 RepID=A0A840TSX3_9BACT|nr:shikimate dehydrogenase [Rhabdobacter roseus]MBB5284373.1 shikimate dehydrogenase [Rhabdobacter roseus]